MLEELTRKLMYGQHKSFITPKTIQNDLEHPSNYDPNQVITKRVSVDKLKKDENWRSSHPVHANAREVKVIADENANKEPIKNIPPGTKNKRCEVDKSRCRFQYSLVKHINIEPHYNEREERYVSPNFYVPWKFLYNWGKAAQTNTQFKVISTPWGCFMLQEHRLRHVYFPCRERDFLEAQYEVEVAFVKEPGYIWDYFRSQFLEVDEYEELHKNADIKNTYFRFNCEIPISLNEVNWENIKDTYRYIYAYEHVVEYSECLMELTYDPIPRRTGIKQITSFEDLILQSIWLQFNYYTECLYKEISRKKQNGEVSKNGRCEMSDIHGLYSYDVETEDRHNYMLYKDIPPKDFTKNMYIREWHYTVAREYNVGHSINFFRFQRKNGRSRYINKH